MKTVEHIRDFLDRFMAWASAQSDVQAVALVGSYARAAARDDSDIDLVILSDQPEKYLEDLVWVEQFGEIEKHQTEDYGKLTSVRVWYEDNFEVEYGFTTPDWAAQPLEPGTEKVIKGGMLVLFERGPSLSPLLTNQ
jgi:predicted nucleotidyltransferase